MTQDDLPARFDVDFTGATLLGIYRVDQKIADGGMGSVWAGEDTNLGRKVVVKVPHVRFLGEPGFGARFSREITELVRLEHPSIVRILAQGTHEDIPFFVLQYLGGGSLEEKLTEAGTGPRSTDAVVPWLRTIAATLDFIHGRGVVHRDVKPENILFDGEGHVFLSDFGVVKALDEDLSVTAAGTGIGSPRYMAPEQGVGRAVGGAADQYGLATTVYEAISGRLPFAGDSAIEVMLAKHKEKPTPLHELVPALPAPCADAVMRGLSSDPDERYACCQDFADAFLAGAGIFDRTPSSGTPALVTPEVDGPRPGRHVLVGALVATLLALALGGVGVAAGWFSSPRGPDAGVPDDPNETRVVLLTAGAEPRRPLRYQPTPGVPESLSIHVVTEEATTLEGSDSPLTNLIDIAMRLDLEVTDVASGGDIGYAWRAPELTLDGAASLPEAARNALSGAAKGLVGRSGTARLSARGIQRALQHDTPPPEDPILKSVFGLIVEFAARPAIPLPQEAVGVGARWEITSTKEHMEGIRITQIVTYEIESLDETEARLRMYIAVTAPNQALEHPRIPTQAQARLKQVVGSGEGEVVVDLDLLGTPELWMTIASETKFTLSTTGEPQELATSRSTRVSVNRD